MATPTLYRRILGDQFDSLPAVMREFHGRPNGGRGSGRFLIERGPDIIAMILCSVLRFPAAGTDVPMTLDVSVEGDRERWVRDFGGRGLTSVQWLQSGLMMEQAGLLRFAFRVSADGTGIRFEFRHASFSSVPLPRFLSPRISVVAAAEGLGWRADIRLSSPWGSPILRYNGLVVPEPRA